jgi:hypothetical protein
MIEKRVIKDNNLLTLGFGLMFADPDNHALRRNLYAGLYYLQFY